MRKFYFNNQEDGFFKKTKRKVVPPSPMTGNPIKYLPIHTYTEYDCAILNVVIHIIKPNNCIYIIQKTVFSKT